jgi:hypothetical protein
MAQANPSGRGGPASSDRTFRILLLNALIRPLAAATLAITIIVVALTGWWWFALIGAAAYAFFVWSALNDPQLTAQVLAEELYPERKLDLGRLRSPYREAVQRALAGRKRIEEAVAGAGTAALRAALADPVQQVREVTDTIYDIALKAQDLQTSIGASNIDLNALDNDIRQLQYQVQYAKDDYLKSQYQATLDAKREQQQNLRDANQALIRWQAQLDNALSALDTIYSQVLKIKSAEVRNLSAATDEVSQSLREQIDNLRITSDAFDQVYGGPARPASDPSVAPPTGRSGHGSGH